MSTAPELTLREKQVVILMAEGKHNKEISTILGISEHTAKFHVNSVLVKTRQTTRLSAVVCCLKHGLLKLDILMPNITQVLPMTATGAAIIEENKAAMEAQKANMLENIVNDIIEELYSENGSEVVEVGKARAQVTAVLKDYFSDA